jgi:uncharacterized damage-inducible protein DinB
VIEDVEAFLRYFDGIHARTVRDVSSLPEEAERWVPPPGPDEESSWGVPRIVAHICEARRFFAGAFLDRGWVWEAWPDGLERREAWVPALERSREDLVRALEGAPTEQLRVRVPMLDDPDRTLAAWRTLMMLVEHEVHHRSQLATYAGQNGWPVQQIFGRTNEWVVSQREAQRRRRDA